MKLLVAGGAMRPAGAFDRDHEALYEEALLAEVDGVTGRARVVLSWRSEGPWDTDAVGHCFKGAAWDGDRLLLCTERDVLEVDPTRWEVARSWSHPWFNDLHGVRRIGGRLAVVSTGLDALLWLADDGTLREAVGLEGELRADPGVDYRARSTKPHRVHANHVAELGGQVWVTRCLPSDVVAVGAGRAVPLGAGPVHDGLPHDGSLWFTAVDGTLLAADPALGRVVRREPAGDGGAGWCRGLWIEDGVAVVGFSRVRATATRWGLAALKGLARGRVDVGVSPTRLVAHELSTRRRLWTVPTEDIGMHAIFAVLPGRPPARSGGG